MLVLAVALLAANIAFSVCFYVLLKRRFSHDRILRDVEKELDLLYKDLQREIDNSLSIIEDRTAALKSLIAAADKRILLAASEIEKREKASSFAARPSNEERRMEARFEPAADMSSAASDADAAGKLAQEEKLERPAAVYTKRQIIEKAAETASLKGSGALAARGIAPEMPEREKVVMLARQDISPGEIAKILSLPQSEVDLILALDL